MRPGHHPPESQWLAYASGGADPARRLLLEAHLEHCDACAARLAPLAEAGGALLRSLAPAAPSPGRFDRILASLPQESPRPAYPIPAVLRALLPVDPERAWRGVLRGGVRVLELAAYEADRARLYLVHLAAGRAFPHHVHGGLEEAVILSGGALDGGLRLEPGDWRAYPPGTAHEPAALPDEDCWILTRVEDEVRLSGWRGILQRM